jgi:SAM-dependent methyltransferase
VVPALRAGAEVVGVDLSPAMVARAREAAPDAELVVGDVTALPFADGSFDVVVSAFVVFFLDDPTAGLREWARVLGPGGRLVMATWAPGDERWAWERQLRIRFAERMDAALLPQIVASVQRIARFDDSAKVEAELRAAGLEPADCAVHPIEFRFDDEDAWWEWNWAQAGRAGLEALPEDAREEFRERAFDNMRRRVRADDGSFPRRYTALFSTAHPSAGEAR